MKFTIITTQSKIYDSFLETGLICRALKKKLIKIKLVNLYDYGLGKHKAIDDAPYGGGPGMLIRVDVVDKALSSIKKRIKDKQPQTILLTPQGCLLTGQMAKKLAKKKELILISGRFEGYDERIRHLVDEEISIGDYVLTSGDLPAMVLVETISRQIPGFIEKSESIKNESFNSLKIGKLKIENSLEYPQYTRPYEFMGKKVPKILLSGNHAAISKWRNDHIRKK